MEATLRHDRDDRDARTLTEAIEAVDEFFAGVFEPFEAWAPSLSVRSQAPNWCRWSRIVHWRY